MDLECLGKRASRIYESSGMADTVTFKRLDEASSGAAHPLYKERKDEEKVYESWTLKCLVDEDPQSNRYGRVGGEVEAEVCFYLYDNVTDEATPRTYVPDHHDKVEWRGTSYEVISVIRIHPSNDKQLGFQIDVKRFR